MNPNSQPSQASAHRSVKYSHKYCIANYSLQKCYMNNSRYCQEKEKPVEPNTGRWLREASAVLHMPSMWEKRACHHEEHCLTSTCHNRTLLWTFSEEDTMRKCWSYHYWIWLLVSLSLMNHQKLAHVLITSSLMKSSNTFSCCSFPCFIKQLNLTRWHVSPSSTASCLVLLHFSCWNMLSSSICDRYNTEQCIHAAWGILSWCSTVLDDKISIFPALIWLPQHWGEHLTIRMHTTMISWWLTILWSVQGACWSKDTWHKLHCLIYPLC